ncbi:MAG: ATP-binding protein [Myxococcota bacterium]
MIRLSRFERKIVGAIALVAFAPLIGALLLGSGVVQDAYYTGVNERIHVQLQNGVSCYRMHLSGLREDAERTADAIAHHHTLVQGVVDENADLAGLLDEALTRYPHVIAVRVYRDDELLNEASRDPGPAAHDPPVALSRDIDDVHRAEVVITAPQVVFDHLQAAGDEADLYERLLEQSAFVAATYLWVYIAFLALIAIVAVILGVVLSRRVTGRVTALARATRRVGAGDLNVTVPTGLRDEVHELSEAFNAMVKDLRESRVRIEYLQRIGAWQDFARRLAHEIKNPLTPIQLAAQEMHRSYDGSDPKYLEKLEDARAIIEEEIATLRRLVGEFSSFARLPAADLSEADLRDFLGDLERALPAIRDDVFPDDDAVPTMEVDVEDVDMTVRIDAMMLKRCLDNLVRNALQALRGRENGKVRVVARRIADHLIVTVEDNGPGVPTTQHDRVFDPYFTTKSDGTGLGLAIVKKVVLEHGGEISYDQSALGGASFTIQLPERS